jgi:activator of HSP90 ATPase
MTSILFTQSLVVAQVKMDTMAQPEQDSTKDITIHQEIDFKANSTQLYETLLSSKKFSDCTRKSFNAFTETSANIDAKVGGAFSLFDGHIIGRILELVPNQRIVEAWRVVDWPSGVYSIARFEFKSNGSGTRLIFDHTGFPEGLKKHLSMGWQQHYWDALNTYLN